MTVVAVPSRPAQAYGAWVLGLFALIAVAALVAQLSMALAGVLYVIGFWIVALHRSDLALMLIFAAAPFQHDISTGGPVKFSLGEFNLILMIPVLLLHALCGRVRIRLGPIVIPSLCYLTLCVFSSILQWRGTESLTSTVQMTLYLLVAVTIFGSLPNHPAQLTPALYGLVAVASFLALCTLCSFSGYVLGMHKNGVGASLSCALLVTAELWFQSRQRSRRRLLLAALFLIGGGLLVTLSRGAWLSAVVGIVILCAVRGRPVLAIKLLLLVLPVLLFLWFMLPAESREYALNLNRSGASIDARYKNQAIAEAEFRRSPIFGVGVGLRKEMDATSILWVTLAETGIFGAVAFTTIFVLLGVAVWRARSRIPEWDWDLSLVALCAALTFGKLAHGMVDHYWSRGPILIAWASVGFLALVKSSSSRRRPQASAGLSLGRDCP